MIISINKLKCHNSHHHYNYLDNTLTFHYADLLNVHRFLQPTGAATAAVYSSHWSWELLDH